MCFDKVAEHGQPFIQPLFDFSFVDGTVWPVPFALNEHQAFPIYLDQHIYLSPCACGLAYYLVVENDVDGLVELPCDFGAYVFKQATSESTRRAFDFEKGLEELVEFVWIAR